jgi:hypothetical protein
MGVDLRFCARDRGSAMEELDFVKVCIGGFWCVKVYRRGRWVFTFVHHVHLVTLGGEQKVNALLFDCWVFVAHDCCMGFRMRKLPLVAVILLAGCDPLSARREQADAMRSVGVSESALMSWCVWTDGIDDPGLSRAICEMVVR